jgi:ribonuclease VapC
MLVNDSSAIVAVIMNEPERAALLHRMGNAGRMLVSVGTIIETRVVLRNKGGEALVKTFDNVIQRPPWRIVPVDMEQADIADAAHVRFGKGTGHPAALNFGDLFAYALAKARGLPLLYKGADFAQTDIDSALDRA